MRKENVSLNENNNAPDKPNANEASDRHFDWGPPASATADGLKEWLVYLLIFICLGAGAWVLLDINGKTSAPSQPERASVPKAAAAVNAFQPQKPQPETGRNEARHFVQLGAFEDGDAAREIFNQLEQDGFKPTLAEPDHQFEFYRVFVGPYANENEAEEISMKLNELEFHCFVIQY